MDARGEPSAAGNVAPGGTPAPRSSPPSGFGPSVDPDTGSLVIAGRWRTAPVEILATDHPLAPPSSRRGRVWALTAAATVVTLGWAGAVVGGLAPDPSAALWPPPSSTASPGPSAAGLAGTTSSSSATAPTSAQAATSTTTSMTTASTTPTPSGPLAGYPITDITPPSDVAPPRWPSLKGPRGHVGFSIVETAELAHDDAPDTGGLRAYYAQDLALSAASVKRGRTVVMRVFAQTQAPVVDYLPGGRLECLGGTPIEPQQKPYGWAVGAVTGSRSTLVFGLYPVAGDDLARLSAVATTTVKVPTVRPSDVHTGHSPDGCYALSQVSAAFTVKIPATVPPGTYRIAPQAPLKVNRVWTTTSDGVLVDLSPATVDPRTVGSLPTITVTA